MEVRAKVRLGETAEESVYTPSGGRKEYTYDQFIAFLINTGKYTSKTAPTRIMEIYDAVLGVNGGEEPTYYYPTLSEETRQLFACFRWFSSEDGTKAEYVRVDPNSEVYVLTADPMTTASAVKWEGDKTLEDVMTEMYITSSKKQCLSLLKDKALDNKGRNSSEPVPLPTLSEYWDVVKKYWARDSHFRLTSSPVEISDDPDVPSFFYWDSSTVKPGPTDAWDEWMECFPEYGKPIFRAWFASIFDPRNKGRQALWLQDQGYTGKSSMIRALTRFIGKRAVAAIQKDSLSNQFGFSQVYGKRLVVYGDSKNPKLIHDSKIHSILGGDIVPVERKNIQAFSAPVHAKVLIGSNTPPEVDLGANSEITRILYIQLREPPEHILKRYCKVENGRVVRHKNGTPVYLGGNLEDKLFPQIGAFLFKCQADYKKLCPNRMDIELTEEMWEVLHSRCPSPEFLSVEKFCQEELTFGPKRSCTPNELMDAFNDFNKLSKQSSFDFSRLKTYLETRHGVGSELMNGKRLLTGVAVEHQNPLQQPATPDDLLGDELP